MIVYKILKDDRSVITKTEYPIPIDGPTKWLDIGERKPVLCSTGYHGWLSFEIAQKYLAYEGGYGGELYIFEMELDGVIVQDYEKAAGQRARLIKLLYTTYHPNDAYWFKKLDAATTVLERLAIYKEASDKFRKVGTTGAGISGYYPVVPARHGDFRPWLPNRCGDCGLSELWHFGDDIQKIKDQTGELTYNFILKSYNWELLEAIRLLRTGMPLE